MNEHLHDRITDAVRTAQQTLKDDKVSATLVAKVSRQLAQQDTRLDTVEKRIKDLSWEDRRGGGFPWGLLLLAGGAYALYQYVPAVQQQVKKLIGQADPGAEGNLNRAGEAAKEAVQAGLHGDNPSDSGKAAVGEVKRAGEKESDAVKNKAEDLADRLKD